VTQLTEECIGRFVETTDRGIGRLHGLGADGKAIVRFFCGPSLSPYKDFEYPVEGLSVTTLPNQVRAFVQESFGWKVGRVDWDGADGGGLVPIAFPKDAGGNPDSALLDIEDFEVRWSGPVENPMEFLAGMASESPRLYRERVTLLEGWFKQKSAASSVNGLFLNNVNLHEHQLSIVRRVTEDHCRRYLLADEVGLGKTIEAGALIKQRLEEQPNSTVLVLVPKHLQGQWVSELRQKFGIAIGVGSVRVLPQENPEDWPAESFDVIVLDEAHHMTRTGSLPEETISQFIKLAHSAEELYLLSATPVRSNEPGFLDLLHFLDPVHYPRDEDGLKDFLQVVEARSEVTSKYIALGIELEDFEVEDICSELLELFPGDQRIASLKNMLGSGVSVDEVVATLREHLSEAYRIHHRLLRTRRNDVVGGSLGVRGRQRSEFWQIEVEDDLSEKREDAIDSYRTFLTELLEEKEVDIKDACESFVNVAERCCASPQAISALAASKNKLIQKWLNGEGSFHLKDFNSVAQEVTQRIAKQLTDLTLAKGSKKVVIFSSFSEVIADVSAKVSSIWASDRLAVHSLDQSDKENENSITNWRENEKCSLLFCDGSAEEGINLQSADLMIHLDLPWAASRLEQRIGRCDRYTGTKMDPIASTVFHFGFQNFDRNWTMFLNEACDIFTRSISSLQYVLSDVELSIWKELIWNDPEVIKDKLPEYKQLLDEELLDIESHDALDSTDLDRGGINRALINCDRDLGFQSTLKDWLEGVHLKLYGIGEKSGDGVYEFRRKKSRPHVPDQLERVFSGWYDERVSFSRKGSALHQAPVLRAGNELFDAIAQHLLGSDRGATYAFARPMKAFDERDPLPVFQMDLLVQAEGNTCLLEAADSCGVGKWVRREIQSAFPTRMETIFYSNGRELQGDDPFEKRILEGYSKEAIPGERFADLNLSKRPNLFKEITENLPQPWASYCEVANDRMQKEILNRQHFTEGLDVATADVREAVERRHSQQLARAEENRLVSDGANLSELLDALSENLEIRHQLLGVGVRFLIDPSLAFGVNQ
jgi:ATP-dependent helicase HepA